jgi:tRNA pseudouridine13 synthase
VNAPLDLLSSANPVFLTADLQGVGGSILAAEDFRVDELAAYSPCGEGEHCLALVRKRGLTTIEAIERICRELRLSPGSVGYAGLKDKFAITSQWISLPRVQPAEVLALELGPELQILEAALHRNKLRPGHLRGNRFTICLHGTQPNSLERAQLILARLAEAGLPNYFGAQRFGRKRDNALQALRALRGESKLPRDRFKRRLIISSLQSHLFNEVLSFRLGPGGPGLNQLLGGEVLQRTDSSGLFVSEDLTTDALRLTRGELVITGPLYGPRMPWPKEGTRAREIEESILARYDISPQYTTLLAKDPSVPSDLQGGWQDLFGRLARGGRRPITVPVGEIALQALAQEGGLRLCFSLPAGSYATVLLGELTKADSDVAEGC